MKFSTDMGDQESVRESLIFIDPDTNNGVVPTFHLAPPKQS
jgi:hypothetical protein